MKVTLKLHASLALGSLAAVLAASGPAAAQMYPGQDVTVNPAVIGGPRGGYGVPQAAGQHNLPPVHLIPPKELRRHKPAAKTAMTEPAPTVVAPPARKPAPTRPAPARTAKAAPPPSQTAPSSTGPATIPFSLSGETPQPQRGAAQPQASQPQKKVASAAPLPKVTPEKGLTKQTAVLFDTNSYALSDNGQASLNNLAFSLKSALANGAERIELYAYAGEPGDKSSDARRLSLKRALAVRQALITDGVPAERIDAHALGGVPAGDNGATDRVDIFVKA